MNLAGVAFRRETPTPSRGSLGDVMTLGFVELRVRCFRDRQLDIDLDTISYVSVAIRSSTIVQF